MAFAEASPQDIAAAWRARDSERMAPCYRRYSDLVVDRAEGAHLFTVDGRDILDFGCGIGVTSLGHRHPAVAAAVQAQLARVWHTSVTALNVPAIEAAEALTRITPRGLDQVFFCNSGAEAVEAAIKLARKATGRTDIVAFEGGFHGRTYGALSLTATKQNYRAGIGPFLPGIHHVAYPRGGASFASDFERLFATRLDPQDVAAVVVEPILGEGGYVVPPPEFLPWLRSVCDDQGILLVADEVQTGMGRTGLFFAVDHVDARPDILCVAKALGNGIPIGAIVAARGLMDAWEPGDHGSTFGGNPIACAAATAVVSTLVAEDLPARAARLGERVLKRARRWQEAVPELADVRGVGLMVGLELLYEDGRPAGDLVESLRKLALERGLLLLGCGTADNVIRLVPPLTIPESELDRGLDILEDCLRELS